MPVDTLRPPAGDVAVRYEGDLTFVTADPQWVQPPFGSIQLDAPSDVVAPAGRPEGRDHVVAWFWDDEANGRLRSRVFPARLGRRGSTRMRPQEPPRCRWRQCSVEICASTKDVGRSCELVRYPRAKPRLGGGPSWSRCVRLRLLHHEREPGAYGKYEPRPVQSPTANRTPPWSSPRQPYQISTRKTGHRGTAGERA